MAQDQASGAAAVKYGLETAMLIAKSLGAEKVGNSRSNEYILNGRKILIKCARVNTKSVGVPYHLLESIDSIMGALETENGVYELYEMSPKTYAEYMTSTRSKGASSGRVPRCK